MVESLEQLRRARQVGFLFSGGASRCVFQAGAVETLLGSGIVPGACLGVSGGAWTAAAVAVGNWRRVRAYWRFFSRMPAIDLHNLLREHSPFQWRELHERAFRRYVTAERLRSSETLPLYVAVTRLRDRAPVIMDVRSAAHPFDVMLASNYLPPYYTHAPVIDGERYGDGSFADNAPYEALLERGCDAVVLMAQKGECEGGLFRSIRDPDHVIPATYRDRVFVIRPRHRLDLAFVERRWDRLERVADLGAARTHELLFGCAAGGEERCAHGRAPSWYVVRLGEWMRGVMGRVGQARPATPPRPAQ
jgi:predicted acylesterase/phospholipase RssA